MKSKAGPALDVDSITARDGGSISKKEARIIAPCLFEIERASGQVTADAVLKAARSKESPLHEFFQWDDTKAAHEHRLATARDLIRSVVYRVRLMKETGATNQYTRAFVNLRQPDFKGENGERPPQRYVSLVRVLDEEPLRLEMLDNAHRDFESWLRKYETLHALAPTMTAAKQLLREIAAIRAAARKDPKK